MKHHDLPSHWSLVRLGAVCKSTNLIDPRNKPNNSFVYIDVSSVSNETFRVVETKELLGVDAPSRARKQVRTNDVIFATVRPTLRRIAMIPTELDLQVCSTGYCVVRANQKNLDPYFVYYYLLTNEVTSRVEAMQTGATYPAISDSELLTLFIPLPPPGEQKAIAGTLKVMQEAMAARQQEVALEQERKVALMQQLFTYGIRGEKVKETPIGKIPSTWQIVKLENAYRFSKKPKSLQYDEFEQIPFVPMELIPIERPHFKEFILKSNEAIASGTYFEPGDVLVAKITPSFENGKQGIIEQLPTPFGIATTEIFPIQEIKGVSNKFFIFYYLLLPTIRNNLAAKMEGTTGRQRLKSNVVKRLAIPLPSVEEQEEIIHILRACDDKIAALENEITCLNELFQALLEQLMTGQLSVQALLEPEDIFTESEIRN